MKRFLLALFIAASSLSLKAQWVSIPDNNFGTWLSNNGYSACMQGNNTIGWQMDTTCPAVVNETQLYCYTANISDLTGVQYFDNLLFLYCYQNHIASLPILPNSLISLKCYENDLTYLSDLPNLLKHLECWHNSIIQIQSLPDSLIYIDCSDNQLGFLPPLPNKLQLLYCQYNNLTSLPSLPNSLTGFMCHRNNLSSLSELPDSLGVFSCDNNPNLTCLPVLKKIKDFIFGNHLDSTTSVTCLPNYPQSCSYSFPPLNTIPLCDWFNISGCQVYSNIGGKIYLDMDSNCVFTTGNIVLRNVPVKLWSAGILLQQTFTDNWGHYAFVADSFGVYTITIDTAFLPFSVLCPQSALATALINQQNSSSFSNDFALVCKPNAGFDIGVTSITAGVHGIELYQGVNNTVRINLQNNSALYGIACQGSFGGSVTLILSGPISYASPANGSVSPNNVSGDTITWNVSNFGSFNAGHPLDLLVHVDSTAQLGDVGCFTVIITHPIGDYNLTNDTLTICFVIGLPVDPNEKLVYPFVNISTDVQWLTYTIQFQNTGTAPAQRIYVDDTIDVALDASTFQLLSYSHQPITQVCNLENRVRFSFPNINLPDSTHNEPQSHGYVQYRIKTKPNLSCGTTIGNPAYIYFDFNAPVVTNTPINTIHYTATTNLQASVCNGESYDFNGDLISNTGDYSDTLQTASVCDSIVSLHLTVFTKDSTSSSQNICNGVVVDFFGQQLNNAGTYTHLLQNMNGCDSVVQLSLNVLPVYNSQVDTTIEQGNTYTLPSGNMVSIAGIYNDTLQTVDGCDSVVTTTLSVMSDVSSIRNPSSAIRIYPNPSRDQLNIQIDETLIGAQLNIYDVTGSLIQTGKLEIRNSQFEIRNLPSGVYIAEIKTKEASVKKRWVKM